MRGGRVKNDSHVSSLGIWMEGCTKDGPHLWAFQGGEANAAESHKSLKGLWEI